MWQAVIGAATFVGIVLFEFTRDWRDGKALFHRNGTAESNRTLQAVLSNQLSLKNHFNDETTVLLHTIVDKLDDVLVNGVRIRGK